MVDSVDRGVERAFLRDTDSVMGHVEVRERALAVLLIPKVKHILKLNLPIDAKRFALAAQLTKQQLQVRLVPSVNPLLPGGADARLASLVLALPFRRVEIGRGFVCETYFAR